MAKFKSQALHIIRIEYWKASGSGNPPSLIPALWSIGILLHKQATHTKHSWGECTFDQGATSILDSRVQDHNWNLNNQFVVQKNIWQSKTGFNISSQRQSFKALSQELVACTICEPKWINSCIKIPAYLLPKEKWSGAWLEP